MNGSTQSFQIFRTHKSPYQSETDILLEKNKWESLSNCRFVNGYDDFPDILLTNTHFDPTLVPKKVFEKVKLIIHPNSGYDNFSAEFVKNCKIPIIIGNTIRAKAVSEYILSALHHRFSSLPLNHHWDKNRSWDRLLLSSKKILLIGYGHVGKILEPTLKLLSKDVSIFDPFCGYSELNYSNADIVILACSLNSKNHEFINQHFLEKLPKDVTIINAARGDLIDESALIEFMSHNPSACAYLDVFSQEPFNETRFSNNSNIYKTSHIAGVFKDLPLEITNFSLKVFSDFCQYQKEGFKFLELYSDLLLQNRLLSEDFLF